DELERLRDKRNQKRLIVHAAACDRLLNAKDDQGFRKAWDFIRHNFSDLYSVKENVSELRKAILQLAVMGKLVPQNPDDPPASELLKEIEEEKERLVKEGKIKKSKKLPEITPDEIPYDLPEGWEWSRLKSLSLLIEYGTSKKTGTDSSKIPVYRMGNIFNGRLIDVNFKHIDENIDDLPRLYLQRNDILFNRTNSYDLVGKTAIYQGKDNISTFASYLIRVKLYEKYIFPFYINMAMNSPYFRKTQIEPEIIQQCGQANFNGTKLSETLIPLPPLPEQHRIVAKVDKLMTLCDQLEQQIDRATDKQTTLLNAVMSRE
ncbi:restriction endonuclease subunit S, partial [Coleofasciculus sp. LEGE 07081]